jgi:MFS family permease
MSGRPVQQNPRSDSSGQPAKQGQAGMRRVGAAGFTGTLIEFYDLQIYTTAAALVFGRVFFPQLGTAAGTIAAFGTFGVAFVARPLGSILFGHFGDRLGRKRTLVITLLLMGVSTVLVGLLPTGEQIGVVAPVLLVVLRILQGLAAGGEWAGAALFVAENAPPHKRAAWAVLPNFGAAIGLSCAGLTFLATTLTMSDEAFLAWGWRVPFLASGVLLGVGLYIRLKMDETPVFTEEVTRTGTATVPFVEALKKQPRAILLGCMVEVPSFALLYLALTHMVSFGVTQLQLSYTHVLLITVASGVFMSIGMLSTSRISDRVGRRPVLIVSTGLAVIWSLVLFPLLAVGTLTAFAIGVVGSTLICGLLLGPVGALMSELFHTRYRYTAAGLCYNAAGILGGAAPPLFAGAIIASAGPFAFGAVLAAVFVASFISCVALPETRHRDLGEAAHTNVS